MKIAIIGSGVYGIAMATSLSQNIGNDIFIWCESEESKVRIESERNSFKALDNVCIPPSIKFSTSYEEVLDGATLVFIMVASKYVSSVVQDMKTFIKDNQIIVVGTKGLNSTYSFAFEEVKKVLNSSLVVISGGNFALDLAKIHPEGLTVATENIDIFNIVKEAYKNTPITLEYSNDLYGTALGGAIKNVFALGSGIIAGMGYSDSTRSLFLTLGINEIKRLLPLIGGNITSLTNFALFGDFVMTATSTKSRNYSYGKLIGEEKYEEAEDFKNKNTVEGIESLKYFYNYLKKKNIDSKLINFLYEYIIEKNYDYKKFCETLQTLKNTD